MTRRPSQFRPAFSAAGEALEARLVLSTSGLTQVAAQVATRSAHAAPTQTTLAVSAGTLGQPITFTATVHAAASAGSPMGSVELLDHGSVLATITLAPNSLAATGKASASSGTFTLTPQPGGPASFFGKHAVTAQFVSSGGFANSGTSRTFAVPQPTYTALPGGVKVATIAPGTGPAIQAGQTANVLYTGYLAKTGQIFDDSSLHGDAPLSFKLGAGQVIPGYDSGTVGMQAGESRIILIPAAEGYGATANGAIPANSTLVFVQTLESIS